MWQTDRNTDPPLERRKGAADLDASAPQGRGYFGLWTIGFEEDEVTPRAGMAKIQTGEQLVPFVSLGGDLCTRRRHAIGIPYACCRRYECEPIKCVDPAEPGPLERRCKRRRRNRIAKPERPANPNILSKVRNATTFSPARTRLDLKWDGNSALVVRRAPFGTPQR